MKTYQKHFIWLLKNIYQLVCDKYFNQENFWIIAKNNWKVCFWCLFKCNFSKVASCRPTVCYSGLFFPTIQLYLLPLCSSKGRGIHRRSRPRMSFKIEALKNFAKIQKKKTVGLLLINTRLRYRCFYENIFRMFFLQNTSGRLLLCKKRKNYQAVFIYWFNPLITEVPIM